MTDLYEKTLRDRMMEGLLPEDRKWLRQYGCDDHATDDKLVAMFAFTVGLARQRDDRFASECARADAHKKMLREVAEAMCTLGRLLDGPPEAFVDAMRKVDDP